MMKRPAAPTPIPGRVPCPCAGRPLPPVCRPGGWAALWRVMGVAAILTAKDPAFP